MNYSDNPQAFLQYLEVKLEHTFETSVNVMFEWNAFEACHIIKIYLDEINQTIKIPLDFEYPALETNHKIYDAIIIYIEKNYTSLLI